MMKYRVQRGSRPSPGRAEEGDCPSALMRRARAGVRFLRTAVSAINKESLCYWQ